MGGKNAPAPPDYGPLLSANEKTATFARKLAQDQFDWAKQVYNENKGLMNQTNESFLKTMEDARVASEEDRARYKSIYQPQEDRMVHDLQTYDTPERRDQEVGAAQANVTQQFDAQRDQAASQLESFGVNPSATRFAALDVGLRGQEAAAKAAAGTGAALSVEDKGRALRAAAIDIGKGYPGSYTAAGQLGNQAAQGAQTGTNAAYQTGANAMGTGPEWLGGSNNALANWGNTLNQQYSNQLGQFNANQNASSGWGSIFGIGAGIAAKKFGFDDGGAVSPEMSPTHGAVMDDVPAAVNVGEFVVPADTVQWLGEKHFHKLTEKTRKERAEQADQAVPVDDTGVQHYAGGGMVAPDRGGLAGPGGMEQFPRTMPTPRGSIAPGSGLEQFPRTMPTPRGSIAPGSGLEHFPGVYGGGMVPLPLGEHFTPIHQGPMIPGPRDRFTPIHQVPNFRPMSYRPPPPIPHYGPDPGRGVGLPIGYPIPQNPYPAPDPGRGVSSGPIAPIQDPYGPDLGRGVSSGPLPLPTAYLQR